MRVSPNPMTNILTKRDSLDTETDLHIGKMVGRNRKNAEADRAKERSLEQILHHSLQREPALRTP